ncbi:MAG: rod-binding protein [Syntrophotaleaceae bacterium]
MELSFDPRLLVNQANSPEPVERLPRTDPEKLRQKCQEFEAVMVQAMLKSMRASVPEGGLLPKGNDQQIFEDLMDQQVAIEMSRKQGMGIADALFRQLQKLETDK